MNEFPQGFYALPLVKGTMKRNESPVGLMKIADKQRYENSVIYMYAGNDPPAVHKPITVYKEKNASAYLVAGRYVGFTETYLKYRPLTDEERRVVVEKLGSGKVVRFLEAQEATA